MLLYYRSSKAYFTVIKYIYDFFFKFKVRTSKQTPFTPSHLMQSPCTINPSLRHHFDSLASEHMEMLSTKTGYSSSSLLLLLPQHSVYLSSYNSSARPAASLPSRFNRIAYHAFKTPTAPQYNLERPRRVRVDGEHVFARQIDFIII